MASVTAGEVLGIKAPESGETVRLPVMLLDTAGAVVTGEAFDADGMSVEYAKEGDTGFTSFPTFDTNNWDEIGHGCYEVILRNSDEAEIALLDTPGHFKLYVKTTATRGDVSLFKVNPADVARDDQWTDAKAAHLDAAITSRHASGAAVASVSGAVGSVAGAVGSVAGNVDGDVSGNVDGSVGSVATRVTANADQIEGADATDAIQAAADAALVALDLDHLIKVAHADGKPVVNSLLDYIMNFDGGQTYDRMTDSLEKLYLGLYGLQTGVSGLGNKGAFLPSGQGWNWGTYSPATDAQEALVDVGVKAKSLGSEVINAASIASNAFAAAKFASDAIAALNAGVIPQVTYPRVVAEVAGESTIELEVSLITISGDTVAQADITPGQMKLTLWRGGVGKQLTDTGGPPHIAGVATDGWIKYPILQATFPDYAPWVAGDVLLCQPDNAECDLNGVAYTIFSDNDQRPRYAIHIIPDDPPAVAGDAMTLAADAIADANVAPDMDTYQALITVAVDEANVTDGWVVTWVGKGGTLTAGITDPTIQVVDAADGSDLVAETAMDQIGETGSYHLDCLTTERMTAGVRYVAIAKATIAGSERQWNRPVVRDSTA